MKGLFVTGTDTGIGKTLISAWLAGRWGADYWKPVQSGLADGTDAETVAALAPSVRIHPSAYMLDAPLSPHQAAARQGIEIKEERFIPPATDNFLVVEGAGGALVPLNGRILMADLMAKLGLPVLVVSRSGLGAINHALLTLEALRARKIKVWGVVLNGPAHPDNARSIETFGKTAILAQIPPLDDPADIMKIKAMERPF